MISRKDEHVELAEQLYQAKPQGFDEVRFIHQSFNELNYADIDLSTTVVGQTLSAPFYINAMTGGSEKTGLINADLARAAEHTGVAMASGSLGAAIKDERLAATFSVIRDNAPKSFLLANVNPTMTVDQARRAVDILAANALQIHVNPAQELVMPEGDRDFRGWLRRVADIVDGVDVPVIVKEVGFGMSHRTVLQLQECGVPTVDVSGRGGTNFVAIENSRREFEEFGYLTGWGQTTIESLLDNYSRVEVDLIASGGVRNPLDVVKALALGAKAVGVSGHFLHVLLDGGITALIAEIESWKTQIRSLMTLVAAPTVAGLLETQVLITGGTAEFARLRGVDLAGLANRAG